VNADRWLMLEFAVLLALALLWIGNGFWYVRHALAALF
jgi:hypothetical protein